MTLDLAALINTIIEEYKRRTGDEKLVEEFIEKVGKSGTYADVYALAKKAGLSLENAIIDAWTFDKNEVYFETMKQLLFKVTGPMHDDIAKACKHIQESMNAASGFKLKPQIAEINDYDINDIADRMKNQGITRIMGELQTLGCKIIDDTEQANMDMLTSSGYEIKIVRTYDDVGLTTGAGKKKDCQFCLDLEGEHEFYSTREARYSGVFSRHPKCGCTIDYTSRKTGKTDYNIQNFHSAKPPRITRDEETARNRERLEKAQEFYGSPKAREVMEKFNSLKNVPASNPNEISKGNKLARNNNVHNNVNSSEKIQRVIELSIRYLNKNDSLYKAAPFIPPIDKYEDIFCHGDEYGVVFKDSKQKEAIVSAKEFCDLIKKTPYYKGGNIRLISCSTGAEPAVVPRYLAKELGIEVLAPTNKVYILTDEIGGKIVGAKMILANNKKDAIMGITNGKWIRFGPGGIIE